MGTPAEPLLESRRFRRLLVWSASGHALLGLLMTVSWSSRPPLLEPAPIFVDLVQETRLAPAATAAAPAAPAPEKTVAIPKPKPAPKPKPKPEPKPKPKPKPKAEPKPKPEPKAKPQPAPAKAEPAKPAPTAEQLLAQIRDRVSTRADGASEAPNGSPRGRFDPELAGYRKQLVVLLQSSWVGARAFRNQGKLEVRYEVNIDGGGSVRTVELQSSSGNRHFDETAERAIWKANPFPQPPRGALVLDVSFDPTGVF